MKVLKCILLSIVAISIILWLWIVIPGYILTWVDGDMHAPEIDTCLDHGGRWDEQLSKCEYE